MGHSREPSTSTPSRSRSRLRATISGLLSFLFVFLAIEGAARVVFTVREDLRAHGPRGEPDWARVQSAELMWELRPNFQGRDENGQPRSFDQAGLVSVDTAQTSESNTIKVVFLGDSSTYGSGVRTEETFVEVLDALSPAISAINLGVPGYSSYQGYRRLLLHGLPLNPDVIVVSFNYNDRRYVLDHDQVDGAERFQRQAEVAATDLTLLDHLYLYRLLRSVLRSVGVVASDYVVDVGRIRIDKTHPRVSPSEYRANLRRIIEVARDNGIEVVLMAMSDSPVQTEHLRRGIRALEEGREDVAIENLKIAVRLRNPFSDLARLHLARAYRAQGRIEEEVLTLTVNPVISLPGGTPIRLDTEYNEIMRQVAAEHDVAVLEVGQILEPHHYLDNVHPDADGHRQIGNLLFELFSAAEATKSTGRQD